MAVFLILPALGTEETKLNFIADPAPETAQLEAMPGLISCAPS